ncbi:MAG: hypothetical protein FMNOHCHN_03597 [Ignavibacteriaceae bacterium]|nr:hypothetical protein [Ignavibacteriaceae bacterium]GIL17949.1 MAG: hypothetical protein BroJett040_17000 [Oligoflexia bacterium]
MGEKKKWQIKSLENQKYAGDNAQSLFTGRALVAQHFSLAFVSLFVVPLFFSHITLAQTTVSQSRAPITEKAQKICSLITEKSQFSYDELFEKSFQEDFPQKILIDIFQQIFSDVGTCLSVNFLTKVEENTYKAQFLAVHQDQSESLFKISIDATTKKIDGLLYEGTLPSSKYMSVEELKVPMRDGTLLRTLIFKKNDSVQVKPVVLTRTPYLYLNEKFPKGHYYQTAKYFLDRGYHFVLQSIRGMHGSEGTIHLFSPIEASDGADTIRWINKQEFANGNIATIGTSYDGFTAMAAGVENPPGLKAIITGAGPTDIATGTFNIRGQLVLAALDYINYLTTGKGVPFTATLTKSLVEKLGPSVQLTEYDNVLFGYNLPEWDLIAKNYTDMTSSFWKERSLLQRLSQVQIPTWHIAGLEIDGNMPDTINNFMASQKNKLISQNHHLILGYWGHGNNTPAGNGKNVASWLGNKIDRILGQFLKSENNNIHQEPQVLLPSHFQQNFTKANSLESIPTDKKILYFENLDNQTQLSETNLQGSDHSSYLYSPTALNQGESDRNLNFGFKARETLYLRGNFHFRLFLRTNVPQTDVIILLSKIDMNGKEGFLTQCLPGRRIQSTQPVIELTSAYCPVFGQIKPGEQLMVSLTSNIFPGFARNTNNTPEKFYSEPLDAQISILHSDEYPSTLTLDLEPAQ